MPKIGTRNVCDTSTSRLTIGTMSASPHSTARSSSPNATLMPIGCRMNSDDRSGASSRLPPRKQTATGLA